MDGVPGGAVFRSRHVVPLVAVHVIRGRSDDPTTDREHAGRLVEMAAAYDEPALRAWTPPKQLAFGRRDANEPGYDAARAVARRRGFPPVERSVGGRAVAYDGDTTVAFGYAVPLSDPRRGLSDRYDRGVETLWTALESVGANVRRGEPPASFCPGDHSLRAGGSGGPEADAGGGKLAGVAQRIGAQSALVAGVVVVDAAGLRGVLEAVYDRLDVPFDPASLGSVAAAGGVSDPGRVTAAIESAFVNGRETVVEPIDR